MPKRRYRFRLIVRFDNLPYAFFDHDTVINPGLHCISVGIHYNLNINSNILLFLFLQKVTKILVTQLPLLLYTCIKYQLISLLVGLSSYPKINLRHVYISSLQLDNIKIITFFKKYL